MRNNIKTISCIVMLSVVIGSCSLFRGYEITELGSANVRSYVTDIEHVLTDDEIVKEFLSVYKSDYEIDGYVMTESGTGGLSAR